MAANRIFARYYASASELAGKHAKLIQLIPKDTPRVRASRDVVTYTRNRQCPDCARAIRIAEPQLLKHACPHAWRYFHGFTQKCPCPLFGMMRFTRFEKLRLEQRVRLETPENAQQAATAAGA